MLLLPFNLMFSNVLGFLTHVIDPKINELMMKLIMHILRMKTMVIHI